MWFIFHAISFVYLLAVGVVIALLQFGLHPGTAMCFASILIIVMAALNRAFKEYRNKQQYMHPWLV